MMLILVWAVIHYIGYKKYLFHMVFSFLHKHIDKVKITLDRLIQK